jgi:hypothetical protein
MLSHWCEAKPIDLAWRRPGRRGSKSARGCMGVIRKGGRLLIKHAFPAQCAFESLGGLVDLAGLAIGALDGGLRGDP